MPTITLTPQQITEIRNEMYKQEEMLTDLEVQALAQKVNEKINLPFLKEDKEFIVFFKIIKFIDKALYQLLPNEYYGLIKDATDGITREEARIIIKRLTPLINDVINIPIMSEKQEALAIEIVLKLIVNAMVKGNRIQKAPV